MVIQICAKCKKGILYGGVSYNGRRYHRDCLVCAYCGQPLTDSVVEHEGAFFHPECKPTSGVTICACCRQPITDSSYILEGKHYHKECFQQHIEKQCCICGQPIHSRYYYDSWGQFAHAEHNGKEPTFCYSCGRIIVGEGFSIGKEATLCHVCAPDAVTTNTAVEKCRKKVLDVFKASGITGIPKDIPIELVPLEEMKGLLGCIHYYDTRTPEKADFHIRMTYGLQELHFRGTLAHEMLHSWLVLYGRKVTDDENEGFCNLGKAFILTKENTPLAHYLLKRMLQNDDIVYGAGYRLQKERYERMGWAGLLNSLRYKP